MLRPRIFYIKSSISLKKDKKFITKGSILQVFSYLCAHIATKLLIFEDVN